MDEHKWLVIKLKPKHFSASPLAALQKPYPKSEETKQIGSAISAGGNIPAAEIFGAIEVVITAPNTVHVNGDEINMPPAHIPPKTLAVLPKQFAVLLKQLDK